MQVKYGNWWGRMADNERAISAPVTSVVPCQLPHGKSVTRGQSAALSEPRTA